MADHARHCWLLMDHLSIERAHVVGHSLERHDRAAARARLPGGGADGRLDGSGATHPVDRAGAVDTFFRGVFGDGYGPALEEGLPGAFEQAVAEADAFFERELPALQQWAFTEDDARRIDQPPWPIEGREACRLRATGTSSN